MAGLQAEFSNLDLSNFQINIVTTPSSKKATSQVKNNLTKFFDGAQVNMFVDPNYKPMNKSATISCYSEVVTVKQ